LKAIIIAGGSGERLRPLTNEIPKCMVKLYGKSFLEWQIDTFRNCNVTDITVVTGYNNHRVNFPDITYINNYEYETTNIYQGLYCAKEKLTEPTIISYGDIIFEKGILYKLLDYSGDIGIAVDLNWEKAYVGRTQHPPSEAENVLLNNNKIVEIKKNIQKKERFQRIGEFIGLMKLSKKGSLIIKNTFEKLSSHKVKFHNANSIKEAYLTDLIQELIDKGISVEPLFIDGKWCEIDTIQDLERAKKIF